MDRPYGPLFYTAPQPSSASSAGGGDGSSPGLTAAAQRDLRKLKEDLENARSLNESRQQQLAALKTEVLALSRDAACEKEAKLDARRKLETVKATIRELTKENAAMASDIRNIRALEAAEKYELSGNIGMLRDSVLQCCHGDLEAVIAAMHHSHSALLDKYETSNLACQAAESAAASLNQQLAVVSRERATLVVTSVAYKKLLKQLQQQQTQTAVSSANQQQATAAKRAPPSLPVAASAVRASASAAPPAVAADLALDYRSTDYLSCGDSTLQRAAHSTSSTGRSIPFAGAGAVSLNNRLLGGAAPMLAPRPPSAPNRISSRGFPSNYDVDVGEDDEDDDAVDQDEADDDDDELLQDESSGNSTYNGSSNSSGGRASAAAIAHTTSTGAQQHQEQLLMGYEAERKFRIPAQRPQIARPASSASSSASSSVGGKRKRTSQPALSSSSSSSASSAVQYVLRDTPVPGDTHASFFRPNVASTQAQQLQRISALPAAPLSQSNLPRKQPLSSAPSSTNSSAPHKAVKKMTSAGGQLPLAWNFTK